jgi:polyisoprenoid-binding protein YceI
VTARADAGLRKQRKTDLRRSEEDTMSTVPTTTTTAIPAGIWAVDPAHSSVEFTVRHLGIANIRGRFRRLDGRLEMPDGSESAKAYGSVEAASIDTGEPQRDDHLRSPDFFDVESYPEITFESTRIEAIDEDEFHVTGNLTMHGVTHPITLHAEVEGVEEDPWGNTRVGIEAQGEITRSDWGMKFNQALGSGNMLVSDKVRINVDVSAIKVS